MKTKLLLLVVLCIQCALTMVAAEERKPAKPNKITAWWRQRVMALPSHCLFLDCPFTISDGDEYEKHLHDAHNFDVQEAVVYLHAIKDPIVKRRKKIRNYQWSSEVLTKYVSQCFLFPSLASGLKGYSNELQQRLPWLGMLDVVPIRFFTNYRRSALNKFVAT